MNDWFHHLRSGWIWPPLIWNNGDLTIQILKILVLICIMIVYNEIVDWYRTGCSNWLLYCNVSTAYVSFPNIDFYIRPKTLHCIFKL
jgi:hypothetical protein